MTPRSFCVNSGELEADELLLTDPEPCESCETGIRWMYGYDGAWRCRSCVHTFAVSKGWDLPPDAPAEPPPPVASPEFQIRVEQLSFSKMSG